MKVRLIINGQTADINDDGLILLTYQNADAEQPAAVKNSYSQNITLPATANNDAIFSHILRSDFRTGAGFNPLARTPFEIRNGAQEILVSGYLKINSGEVGKGYEISLFGGLGGFFYSLMYNADGTEQTLADMQWMDGVFKTSDDISINISAAAFVTRYNGSFDASKPYAFAPFHEGLPDDFDCNKAWYREGGDPQFQEFRTTESDSGTIFYPKNRLTDPNAGMILEFSNEHDGWAMEEFRNTLQRPMWSIKAFLDAICLPANNGGYNVTIDPALYESDFIQKGYVTLKNDWRDKVSGDAVTFADLLDETHTPADYLLSITKICGLMFLFDEKSRDVRILTRDDYYWEHTRTRFNLHGLIAEDRGKTITPLLMSDKWQVLSAENYGSKAEDFADRKGRQYGGLWINTNYEFGGDKNEILSKSVFKGAADTLDTSLDYRFFHYDRVNEPPGSTSYYLKFNYTDTVKYTLYAAPDAQGNQEPHEFEPIPGRTRYNTWSFRPHPYNSNIEMGNITELPELHDADGKNEDGMDIIVFYEGSAVTPKNFYATQENADMLNLNDGVPCWDISQLAANRITQFPVFRRQYGRGAGSISALFALPSEFFTPDSSYYNAVPAENYIGERFWRRWLAERNNVDVRRMRCWVNLRDKSLPRVGAELLRYFWYYEGAWWVLDKINSHSITTDDLTECEFIKVVDIDNYLQGQDFGGAKRLIDRYGDNVMTLENEQVVTK